MIKQINVLRIFLSGFLVWLTFSFIHGQDELSLDKIKLPKGFAIEVYSDNVENARAMSFAEDGTLFVGSRIAGNIYAIAPDRDVFLIDKDLEMPVGLDYHDGDLYVSEVSRILKYEGILETYKSSPEPVVINDRFPTDKWHGWKFIKVGPDNKIYVPVGAPCNVCDSSNIIYASICRINLDGSNMEIYAEGVRNTVGFDWEPVYRNLWFTDNGRDWMGDDLPPDELNKASTHGSHFGFPYKHGSNVRDPEFWKLKPRNSVFVAPSLELPAHVAALGMRFYTGEMFPEPYDDGIFIAEHGSWNRSEKIGYRISFVPVKKSVAMEYKVFASGWVENEVAWGRPVDVEIGPDGALYVSDDFAGCIYRIYYISEK